MLQLLMSRMKGSIDPQDIIRRVTSHGNSAGMRLGEFKDVVLNMISANEQEILLYEAINRAFNDDLVIIHRNKIQLLVFHSLPHYPTMLCFHSKRLCLRICFRHGPSPQRRCHVKGDHEEDEEEEDTCEKRRANLLLNRDSAITDGSESGPGGDALFEELGKINTNIDLTQIKVPAIPWSKPDVKEDFRKV